MRLSLLVLALGTLIQPAQAQDISAEFARTYSLLTLPGSQGMNPDAAILAIEAVLPLLEGDWVRGDILSGDTGQVPADRISDACRRNSDRLVLRPPHGFEMKRIRSGEEPSLHVRYDYQGLNIFQRHFDESEWLTYLGFGEDRPAMSTMYLGQSRGEVFLFLPSPNVMFFQLSRGGAEFYLRCPAR